MMLAVNCPSDFTEGQCIDKKVRLPQVREEVDLQEPLPSC